ncbi:MAG: GrpB family protein [Ruminiclostridium sp.]|nr:GrpB family protein [Ruminiclostridium sp.]
MKEHISELTPEEFQKIFPITLVEYNPGYKDMYERESRKILDTIGHQNTVRINHIGSSAVPGLIAKPVVDILLEVDGVCDITQILGKLKTIGFGTEICNRSEDPFRLLLAKGMSCKGFAEEVFLLHIRYAGEWDELYFRDYLLDHPDTAREYGELKIKILEDINAGRTERMPDGKPNGYSRAKYEFVKRISEDAKREYSGRYKPH